MPDEHDHDICVCGDDAQNNGIFCACPCGKCVASLERYKARRLKDEAAVRHNEAMLEKDRLRRVAARFKEATGITITDLRAALLADYNSKPKGQA